MRIGIVTKPRLSAACDTLVELETWLRGRADAVWSTECAELMNGVDRVVLDREALSAVVDLVLVLGGDGTLLAVADRIGQSERDVPILGINFGSLGFLTEITRAELYSSLESVLSGRAELDERMMLRGTISKPGQPAEARIVLNDVVFTRAALSRMVDLAVTVGDQFVTSVRADGLIVASPTGSTAYNLSAAGPIVHPALSAMVLTPIAPHTLTLRPIVIPAERDVRVRPSESNGGADVYVTFDGQWGVPLKDGDEVAIARAHRPLRLVRATTRSYFEVLRQKLKWGER